MRHKLLRDLFPVPVYGPPSGGSGSMMLALDDPLRNTPEKAEKYARVVDMLAKSQHAKATEADVAAALKLLSPVIVPPKCECTGAPYGHSIGCQYREATPFA